MKSIRVQFSNGNSLVTSINGTDEEIRAYYIGRLFEMSEGVMARATEIEFLDSPASNPDLFLAKSFDNSACIK